MHKFLVDWLICPACHDALDWNITHATAERIAAAEVRCTACGADYAVRDEIGVFLTPDLPRNDLWDKIDSGLTRYLREHPDVEQQLMQTPLEELNPADQFFRMMVLEERGEFSHAREIKTGAFSKLYTGAYNTGWQHQIDYVLSRVAVTSEPVVDLACGRGYLAEAVARQYPNPIIATDFSPVVLRRNRDEWRQLGLYDQVSLLAFDARRTPLKTGCINLMTTNLGLPNIEHPGDLLQELGRIINGKLLAISHFYPPDDTVNAKTIREYGLEPFLYEQTARDQFKNANWHAELASVYTGPAEPTPTGEIIPSGIDGLPVASTTLKWCTVVAQPADRS